MEFLNRRERRIIRTESKYVQICKQVIVEFLCIFPKVIVPVCMIAIHPI